ncbi:unnamed protein product [Tilletia controversa]|nr:unnamed protein product [Tilletia controversa]
MRSQDQDAAAEEEQEASQSDDSSMAGDDDLPAQPTETPRRNSVPAMLPMASPLTPYPALSTPFHSRGAPGSTPFNAATSPTRTTLRVDNESASPGTLQRANSSASLLLMKSSEHPVIQISSLDPRAAAKAAAILKLHYQYVEEGFSHEEVDVMELKKYGLSVRDIRGLSAHDVSELPNVLADEELKELERQQGRSIRARHRQSSLASPIFFRSKGKTKAKQDGDWTLSGSSDSDKPTPPLTPSTDLMSSSPARSGTGFSPKKGNSTPRLPGAWVWTPAKAQQSVTKGKVPESHGRSLVKGGNNSTPRLSPDPLVWELSEWSALDHVFRQRVREHAIRLLDASELGSNSDTCPLTASSSAQRLQIRSASDCNTTKKLKAHCLAALEVDVEKVFTTFVQKHHIQESQLNGVWSSHRFATRIAALQRRYLDRVDKHYRSKHVEQSQLELVAIAHAELNEMHEPLNEANRSAGREGVLRLNAAELSVDPSKTSMPAPSAQASPEIFPTEDSIDFSLGMASSSAKGKAIYARGGEGMLHSTPVIRRSADAGTVGARRTATPKMTPSSSTLTAGRKDLRRAVLERTHGGNTDEPEPEPLFAAKGLGANKDDTAGPRPIQSNDLRRSSTPKPQSRLQSGGAENLTPAERLRSRLAASQ